MAQEEIHKIRELVQEGRYDQAIQKLIELTKGSGFSNEAIVHRTRFQELLEGKRKGIWTESQVDAKRNELFFSILNLLDEIEKKQALAIPGQKKKTGNLILSFGIGGVFLFLFFGIFFVTKQGFPFKKLLPQTESLEPKDTLLKDNQNKVEDPPDPEEEILAEDTLTGTFEVIYSLNGRKINLELINAAYPVRFNFKMNDAIVLSTSLKDCRKCELALTIPVEEANKNYVQLMDRNGEIEYIDFQRVDNKWVSGKARESRDGVSYSFVLANGYLVFVHNLRHIPKKGSWCYLNENPEGTCNYRYYSFSAALESCPKGWRIPSSKDFRAILGHFKGLNGEQIFEKLTTYEFGSPYLINGVGFRKPNGGFEYNREKSYYWLNDGKGPKKAIAINNKDRSITIEEVNEDLAMPCICVRKYDR